MSSHFDLGGNFNALFAISLRHDNWRCFWIIYWLIIWFIYTDDFNCLFIVNSAVLQIFPQFLDRLQIDVVGLVNDELMLPLAKNIIPLFELLGC